MRGQEAAKGGPIQRYIALLREQETVDWRIKRRARLLWCVAETLGGEDRLLSATGEEIQRAVSARVAQKKDAVLNWHTDMNAFLDFLVREGLREENPLAAALPAPTGAAGLRRRRSRSTLHEAQELEDLRDRVILTLLRETDIRPDELRSLTVGCCDPDRARLSPSPGRRVLLNGFALRLLNEYLAALHSYATTPDTAPLFINAQTGAPLPESHCWSLIRSDLRLAASATVSPAY
jgi:site-specific recombinase XerD